MFKYNMGVVPQPITDLFALNNETELQYKTNS